MIVKTILYDYYHHCEFHKLEYQHLFITSLQIAAQFHFLRTEVKPIIYLYPPEINKTIGFTIGVLTISEKTKIRDSHQMLLLLLNNLCKLTSIPQKSQENHFAAFEYCFSILLIQKH